MIAEAVDAVAVATAEVAQANWERRSFERWIAATDRVLGTLEALNLRGQVRISAAAWRRLRGSLSELPAEALAVLAGGTRVEKLMDGVYAAQEALFRLRDPAYAGDDEAEAADPLVAVEIRERVTTVECGTVGAIVQGFPQLQDQVVRATVHAMLGSGELVLGEVDGRRRFAVGEGGE